VIDGLELDQCSSCEVQLYNVSWIWFELEHGIFHLILVKICSEAPLRVLNYVTPFSTCFNFVIVFAKYWQKKL
jgi:hypothetical protein